MRKGVLLKKEGRESGVPDMFLAVPSGTKHGLFIEFKTAVGKLSPTQFDWQKKLVLQGYKALVIRSLEEAIDATEKYLL